MLIVIGLAGKIRLALMFLHGSGKPFDIEQRIFGPRAERLLSHGIALVLPASPLKDGKVHFWYSTWVWTLMGS